MNVGTGRVLRSVMRTGVVVATLACVATRAPAQYDVRMWGSFEDGKLPANTQLVGTNATGNIRPVEAATVAGMPPEFRSARASAETGKYVLHMHIDPGADPKQSYTNAIVLGAILDRDSLGNKGRAIYQADLFLPSIDNLPSIAVLAMQPDMAAPGRLGSPKKFYRFGVLARKESYFSLVEPSTTEATVMRKDRELLAAVPLPGWHRLSIVFDGSDRIHCYIDGREMPFSPVTDTRLKKLAIGVMLATKSKAMDAYVDNLSIQFTGEAEVMPISPYSDGWTIAAGPPGSRSPATQATAAPAQPAGGAWLDATSAWAMAQRDKRSMLLYFYSPGSLATEELEGVFRANTGAQQFLGQYACGRVDVNQLQGGMLAKQYNVFKVPTLFVIPPDAASFTRSTYRRGDKWESIAAELSRKP